jgi:acyl-coenzyme A thioesterase PaaI-like protein
MRIPKSYSADMDATTDDTQPFWAHRTEDRVSRERSALALRQVVTQLLQANAPPAAFTEAAERLEALAAELRAWPVRESTPPLTSGYLGHRSILLPAVQYDVSDPQAFVTRTRLGIGYEGPPGRVHGGVVAYLFDCVFGLAFGHLGIPSAMTGTMTVKYLAATPLDAELVVRMTLNRVEGRKAFLDGTLTADGTATASAEVIMIGPAAAN